ncbi:MAG: VOC family protein [Planctomycetes bacterium]|nr:VOC family protein [Planctomycetota bacterium]
MIKSIDHVQVAVPPALENAALRFYGGLLGLTRLDKPEGTDDARGAWFAAGNIQLHVGVQLQGFVAASKAHVGFVVQDLDRMKVLLKGDGRPVKDGGNVGGLRRIFSEDPAGNRIEFLQAP